MKQQKPAAKPQQNKAVSQLSKQARQALKAKQAKQAKQKRRAVLTAAFGTGVLVCAAVGVVVLFITGVFKLPSATTSGSGADDAPYKDYKFSNYITLGEYKGVEAQFASETLDPAGLEEIAKQSFSGSGVSLVVDVDAKTEVASGDFVSFDFEGASPGLSEEVLSSMTATNFDLKIGSNNFIPGFEEQIIGHKREEPFDVNVTFPEDYQQADLAGRAVVFHCTIHAIGDRQVLTDSKVEELTQGQYTTIDQFYNYFRDQEKSQNLQTALQAAYATAKVLSVPQKEVDFYVNSLEEQVKANGQTLEEYVQSSGYTREQYLQEEEEYVKQELFCFAVAEKEGLKVSDADMKAYLEEQRTGNAQLADASDEELLQQMGGKSSVVRMLMRNKVAEFIYDNAKKN